jgi:hypothetical protein
MASVMATGHCSSELHIAEHFYKDTVLCDLLGVGQDKINDDRLYRALDRLLPHKESLEVHLKDRLGTLFGLEYDILLYDVTSTYFEGQAKGNSLAQRGYMLVIHYGFRLGFQGYQN